MTPSLLTVLPVAWFFIVDMVDMVGTLAVANAASTFR